MYLPLTDVSQTTFNNLFVMPSFYFSSMEKSRSNAFLEPTSTKQWGLLFLLKVTTGALDAIRSHDWWIRNQTRYPQRLGIDVWHVLVISWCNKGTIDLHIDEWYYRKQSWPNSIFTYLIGLARWSNIVEVILFLYFCPSTYTPPTCMFSLWTRRARCKKNTQVHYSPNS